MKFYGIRRLLFLSAPVAASVFFIFPEILDPRHPQVAYTAGIAVWMALWWMTEVVPLAVTALLPVALFPFFGIMSGKAVAETYFNHLIFLFIGGFLMALAMEKWNFHRRLALFLLRRTGLHAAGMLAGFMFVTAFLSMWISNTATAMMMVPILLSITAKLEDLYGAARVEGPEKGFLLGIAYAASVGGIATLIGTPPNLSFARIFKIYFPEAPEITFARWMMFALPLSVFLLIVIFLVLYFIYFRRTRFDVRAGRRMLDEEYRKLGPMSYEEKWVAFLFGLLVILWLFRRPLDLGPVHVPGWSEWFARPSYITDGNVAVLVAVLLFLIPARRKEKGPFLMDWATARRIPWGIILLFGGGFALASGFKESGLSAYIGESLSGLGNWHPLWILLLTVATITFLTELTSNTATVETFLPVLASISVALHIHPLFLMIPATIAGSFAFMLPVATPPNAIVFGSGKLRVRDMVRTGFWLNVTGILVLTVFAYFFLKWVFDADPHVLPPWAH
ncbi:MAG: SLC13/DASS family transporter [Chlorobi bacterium]|nr:SLC13/DASS family transporter [Chlorobiota bacterium]